MERLNAGMLNQARTSGPATIPQRPPSRASGFVQPPRNGQPGPPNEAAGLGVEYATLIGSIAAW